MSIKFEILEYEFQYDRFDQHREMTQGQEVKFHEIEVIMEMNEIWNDFAIMRSNYFVTFHEIKICNNDSIP